MSRSMIALISGIALLGLLGCGGSAGTEPTAKVTGVVTLNGNAVENASVGFVPEKGRPGSGVTNAEGKFVISTFDKGDGAVLGKHKIVITTASSGEPQPQPGMPGYIEWQKKQKRLPAKYNSPTTTPLSEEVVAGKVNEYKFDMKP